MPGSGNASLGGSMEQNARNGFTGILDGLRTLTGIVARAGGRRRLMALALVMAAILVINAASQIRLNEWSGAFYDALAQRNLPGFLNQLGVFALIAGFLLVLNVTQGWVNSLIKIGMREAIARDVLAEWLKPNRAYLMPLTGSLGANPDQRIQDDARSLTDITTDFCVGLMQASLLLLSFIGVLWTLSENVVFMAYGTSFTIPGYMVWCALAYALAGSWLTWRVGRPLAALNDEIRAKEADFRFTIVRAHESAEGIALYRGEEDEARIVSGRLDAVLAVMRRLAGRYARLNWVTASYGWAAIVFPIIVTAPGYFAGTLSFGTLMMVVGAFNQVQSSLRWYVDNYGNIAAWQAMSWRVIAYRHNLGRLNTLGGEAGRIELVEDTGERLAANAEFAVSCPNGRITLEEPDFSVAAGEHVLIHGGPGCGKSTFFRALAGLWPWGAGKVEAPPRGGIMFLPHFPYIPLGTLRDVLTYPAPGKFSDTAVRAALERLRLGHRAANLDEVARWDKELPLDEQQRIAFVRVLLHAPQWVIEDESMSALDDEARQIVQSIFETELAGTAVVSIGRDELRNHFYHRIYHLRTQPPGLRLPLQWREEADTGG